MANLDSTNVIGKLRVSDSVICNSSVTASSFVGSLNGNATSSSLLYITSLNSSALYLGGTKSVAIANQNYYAGSTLAYILNGYLYSKGHHVSGADYAELMEWADGNPKGEDRTGLFVTFSDDSPSCICIANSQTEDIHGIVSATPSILGNCAEDYWIGKYKRDIYGRVLTQTVSLPATRDENGNIIQEETTIEEPIISEEYDATIPYTPRTHRSEWASIGLIGQLIVQDDGTCIAGRYCKCGEGGKATFSTKRGWRVLERLDETHIKVYFK